MFGPCRAKVLTLVTRFFQQGLASWIFGFVLAHALLILNTVSFFVLQNSCPGLANIRTTCRCKRCLRTGKFFEA